MTQGERMIFIIDDFGQRDIHLHVFIVTLSVLRF
jgi:hypothetical protein